MVCKKTLSIMLMLRVFVSPVTAEIVILVVGFGLVFLADVLHVAGVPLNSVIRENIANIVRTNTNVLDEYVHINIAIVCFTYVCF